VRPIRLNSAVTGRAGDQDLGSATRAEDEIFLGRRTALRTWAGSYLGWEVPRSCIKACLRRVGMGINGNVIQRVVSAHQFYLQMCLVNVKVAFTYILMLAAICEGSVKRAYCLCEGNSRAQTNLTPAQSDRFMWKLVKRRNRGSCASRPEGRAHRRGNGLKWVD
jgi:hypothetical protein